MTDFIMKDNRHLYNSIMRDVYDVFTGRVNEDFLDDVLADDSKTSGQTAA